MIRHYNTAGHTVGTQIGPKPRLDNRIHTQNSAAEQEIGELFSDVYIKKDGLLIGIGRKLNPPFNE